MIFFGNTRKEKMMTNKKRKKRIACAQQNLIAHDPKLCLWPSSSSSKFESSFIHSYVLSFNLSFFFFFPEISSFFNLVNGTCLTELTVQSHPLNNNLLSICFSLLCFLLLLLLLLVLLFLLTEFRALRSCNSISGLWTKPSRKNSQTVDFRFRLFEMGILIWGLGLGQLKN